MPKNQVISLHEARYARAYRTLLTDLAAFCQEALEEEPRAFHQFYGAALPDSEEESIPLELLDWAAFNYRDWEGETLAAEFADLSADELDDASQELIAAWRSSRMGLYRVQQDTGLTIALTDWFTGEAFTVTVDSVDDPLQRGDLVICRLLPVGSGFRFGYSVLSLPEADMPPISSPLERELARLRRQKPEATWDDLLAERWPLVREILNAADEGLALADLAPGPASLGQLVAQPGAPTLHRRVSELLDEELEEAELPAPARAHALRLWWDAVAALKPASGKAEVWAAAVAYVLWHDIMLDDLSTPGALSEAFEVQAASLVNRAKQIARALDVAPFDDRYTDPLDPRVRAELRLTGLSYSLAAAADPDVRTAAQLDREGAALLALGKLAEAKAKFTEGVRLAPDAAASVNNLALVLFLEGKYEEAIERVAPVLRQRPDHVYTLSMQGMCYAALNQLKEARSFTDRAKKVFLRDRATDPALRAPEGRGVLQRLLHALAAVADDKGILAVAGGEQPDQMDPPSLRRAGIAAARLGHTAEAQEWLELARDRGQDLYLVEPFLAALELMKQKRIPPFRLDYAEHYTPEEIPTATNAVTKAILVHAIFYTQEKTAADCVRQLGSMQDPWAAKCLRHMLSLADLPVAVQAAVIREMVRRKELDPARISERNLGLKIAASFAAMSVQQEKSQAQKSRKLLALPLSPGDLLESLFAARSKGALDRGAVKLGIHQTHRYKKDGLCQLMARQLPAVAGGLYQGLAEAERILVKRLLQHGPLAWAALSAEYSLHGHPDVMAGSVLDGPWLAGLIHIGTPTGSSQPLVFVPDVLRSSLI
ncbi:MAG TPA: tetratricopeptide repeat protein [Symbiobacteriaceae bacterium]|nr:tetratricopeptide repeat protein [Symbiobacteriaceae bacterium]